MKKKISAVALMVVLCIICFLLRSKNQPQANFLNKTASPTQSSLVVVKTNSFPDALNVMSTQDIVQWKAAIKNLRQINVGDPGDEDNWIMEQKNPNEGIPFVIGNTNGAWILFDSWFININAKKDTGKISSLEMQSVRMNGAEIRQHGDALLQLMNKDATTFDAWCEKVGNGWIDEPEFSSVASHLPNSHKTFGFQIRSTFDAKKPWYILLIITDP